MTEKKQFSMGSFLKSFLVWFAIFYVIMWGYQKFFAPEPEMETSVDGDVTIETIRGGDELTIGNLAQWTIVNHSSDMITFPQPCGAETSSLQVLELGLGEKKVITDFSDCGEFSIEEFTLQPEEARAFHLRDWNQDLFSEEGTYAIAMVFQPEDSEQEPLIIQSEVVEFKAPNIIKRLFRALISKPLFNLLVILSQHMAFGWAIVILTILVRLALYLPNQNAMKSQRRMQQLQPKLDELRKKYGKDQQQMAKKTMELYKTHKVSPMSSCWPMLIQLPIMIGVYWIVREGLSPHLSHLLYPFNLNVDLTNFDEMFLGLDLTKRNILVLPIIVAIAQWCAVKLSMVRAAKKRTTNTNAKTPSQMEQMNTMMLWVMPAMMGFFTATFPAAVGIYWFTSTIFAIGQQWIVNHLLDKPQVIKKVV
jgi:YidC/Oxa1 family membrane protein insertase